MPIQRPTAMRLVSESEFKLVNESYPPLVGTLSDKALMQRMERVRKARDKYHAVVERQQGKTQAGAGRGSAQPAALKDAMSRQKIFEETLARFERQSAKAAPASDNDAAAPGSRKAKATTRAKSATSNSAGMKRSVNIAAQQVEGKKTASKGGAQGTSKASVKTANKAAAKTGTKSPAPKAVKGKGAATKATPRGRHGAMVPANTLR
ncbi:hypothetical protein [Noviherbaspirillum malthae]|uniref:hypothetical protein n=1 Tax=Noviherbaspirillum malthae TaxID=1260987 RepID=UPI00188FFDF6|nr:hypothetical protein [Noviherbaspirillum malthae]